ncbi:hypothetical protein JXB01_04195 [Candidatus Micrarchaeota archaeon]|nr:hypothetical protein [Candidatus Micrarchaeota archaeon]
MKDNLLFIGIVVLLVAVIGVWYSGIDLFPPQNNDGTNQSADLGSKEDFQNYVLSSEKVYIVMDIRDASDNETAVKIMQCGIDYAGSQGLSPKQKEIYSFDGDGCYSSATGNMRTIEECADEFQSGPTFYIVEGDSTEFSKEFAWVGVNQSYDGECNVFLY